MCVFEHNDNRADQAPSFATVGENLLATSNSTVDYTSYVREWNSEEQFYNYASNTCSRVCEHYTQVFCVHIAISEI